MARKHALAIHMHRTGATLSVVATFLSSCEGNRLANTVQQRCTRVNAKFVILAINAQRDRNGALDARTDIDRSRIFFSSSGTCEGRYIRRRETCGHTAPASQKKSATRWIWRTRLRIVI